MNLKQLKKELLQKEEIREEYSKYDLAFEIGEMIIDARIKLGITQKKLAQLVGTKQPSIARLENGTNLPSLKFLDKIAKKMNTHLIAPKFAFLEETNIASGQSGVGTTMTFYMRNENSVLSALREEGFTSPYRHFPHELIYSQSNTAASEVERVGVEAVI